MPRACWKREQLSEAKKDPRPPCILICGRKRSTCDSVKSQFLTDGQCMWPEQSRIRGVVTRSDSPALKEERRLDICDAVPGACQTLGEMSLS